MAHASLDTAPREQLEKELIAERMRYLDHCEKRFIPFVKHVWPEFIDGKHHRQLAKKFEDIATGKIKRLIVNMPIRIVLYLSNSLDIGVDRI